MGANDSNARITPSPDSCIAAEDAGRGGVGITETETEAGGSTADNDAFAVGATDDSDAEDSAKDGEL